MHGLRNRGPGKSCLTLLVVPLAWRAFSVSPQVSCSSPASSYPSSPPRPPLLWMWHCRGREMREVWGREMREVWGEGDERYGGREMRGMGEGR